MYSKDQVAKTSQDFCKERWGGDKMEKGFALQNIKTYR